MVAILEAIKQGFLSFDELAENNYLKGEKSRNFPGVFIYAWL